MEADLKYPIFIFVKGDHMVYVIWREKEYKTTDIVWLKKYRRRNEVVIDSAGVKYIEKRRYMVNWRGIRGFTGMHCNVIAINYEYEIVSI